MKVFAMHDRKSGEYFGISVWPNEELYKRSLVADVNDPNPRNLLSNHPADFDLFCLGTFDQKSGSIVSDISYLCSCSDLKRKEATHE